MDSMSNPGLGNLGNTCFMNAVVQLIVSAALVASAAPEACEAFESAASAASAAQAAVAPDGAAASATCVARHNAPVSPSLTEKSRPGSASTHGLERASLLAPWQMPTAQQMRLVRSLHQPHVHGGHGTPCARLQDAEDRCHRSSEREHERAGRVHETHDAGDARAKK